MYLSLIVPAYNEELRIGASLSHVLEYLDRLPDAAEVIVVNDGSLDGTSKVIEAFVGHQPTQVHLLSYPENRGKGYAVRTGMLAACGIYRVYYDADGSTPIEELDKLLQRFEAGADIVIGSRSIAGAEVQVRQAWYREQMGKTFNLLLRAFGLTRFRDTQCGFKGFTARACGIVFPRQSIMRYSFDAEDPLHRPRSRASYRRSARALDQLAAVPRPSLVGRVAHVLGLAADSCLEPVGQVRLNM